MNNLNTSTFGLQCLTTSQICHFACNQIWCDHESFCLWLQFPVTCVTIVSCHLYDNQSLLMWPNFPVILVTTSHFYVTKSPCDQYSFFPWQILPVTCVTTSYFSFGKVFPSHFSCDQLTFQSLCDLQSLFPVTYVPVTLVITCHFFLWQAFQSPLWPPVTAIVTKSTSHFTCDQNLMNRTCGVFPLSPTCYLSILEYLVQQHTMHAISSWTLVFTSLNQGTNSRNQSIVDYNPVLWGSVLHGQKWIIWILLHILFYHESLLSKCEMWILLCLN